MEKIFEGLKAHENLFRKWRETLGAEARNGAGAGHCEIQLQAWESLAHTHFNHQLRLLDAGRIRATSKEYTALITDLTKLLHRTFVKNPGDQRYEKVKRFQITAMLPEEFYNGKQFEFLSINKKATPMICRHNWEEYKEMAGEKNPEFWRGNSDILLERWILARNAAVPVPLKLKGIELLAGEQLLGEQCRLAIEVNLEESSALGYDVAQKQPFENYLSGENFCVKQRFFENMDWRKKQQAELVELFQVLITKDWSYHPICDEKDVDRCQEPSRTWRNLIEVFCGQFHANSAGAKVAILDHDSINLIKGSEHLSKFFEMDRVPELSLFGLERNGCSQPEWVFGVLGHYRPFTRDIEMEFISMQRAKEVFSEISRAFTKGSSSRPLLEYLEEKRSPADNFSASEDIFISYRRDGGGKYLASHVREELKKENYSVFMDVFGKLSGGLTNSLRSKIAAATDVVVILTKGCLEERNEKDYLRDEILAALAAGRHIVPIAEPEFIMPKLPPEFAIFEDLAREEYNFKTPGVGIRRLIDQLASKPATRRSSSSRRKPAALK